MDFFKGPGMCWPTIIASVFALLTLYNIYRQPTVDAFSVANKKKAFTNALIGNAIFIIIIYQLCKTGHHTASWVVLFTPIIIVLLAVFFAVEALSAVIGSLPRPNPPPNNPPAVVHIPTPQPTPATISIK